MGPLGKYATYRWLSAGRGGGGGGGAGLVLVVGIFAVVVGVLYAVSEVLSFVWGVVYGIVRPVLVAFPLVTVPLAVVLFGWLFTRVGPYSAEKTEAFLDGAGDKLPFAARAAWAVAAINVTFLTAHTESFPEPNGVLGIALGLAVALLLLYGIYEFFHLPYRCLRLVLHAPGGSGYAVAFLSPMLFVVLAGAFDVSLGGSLALPAGVSSEIAVAVGSLAFVNGTALGGVLAVLWNRDEIRTHGVAARDSGRGGSGSDTASSGQPTSNTD